MESPLVDALQNEATATASRCVTRRTAVGLAASALLSTWGISLCACAAPDSNKGVNTIVKGAEIDEEWQTPPRQSASERQAALAQAAANAVPLGEEVVLTDADLTTMYSVEAANVRQYGDWVGSMGIRVERATIYASLDEARAARDLGEVTGFGEAGAQEEGLLYLLVDVHVSNIDSVGQFLRDDKLYAIYIEGVDNPPAPDYLFLSTTFEILTTDPKGIFGGRDHASFAGGVDGSGSIFNLWAFYELAPGEETTLSIGWWVYADTDPSTFYLATGDTNDSSPCPEVLFDLGLGKDTASE